MKIYTCKHCGKQFEFESDKKAGGFMSAHIRMCDKNPNHEYYIQALKAGSKTMNRKVIQRQKDENAKDLATRKERFFECEKCHKTYSIILSDNEEKRYAKAKHFCSSKCSHSRILTEEQRKQISLKLRKHTQKRCPICNSLFEEKGKYCSLKCKDAAHKIRYSSEEFIKQCKRAGKISAAKNKRRSRNEIEFSMLCEKHFKHVENNIPYFNGWDADVLIFDYKIAILWNGPWHYKEIFKTGQQTLKCIQNRDRIKIKEIKNAGWIPYTIKDMGKANKDKVKQEFSTFLDFLSKYNINCGIQ